MFFPIQKWACSLFRYFHKFWFWYLKSTIIWDMSSLKQLLYMAILSERQAPLLNLVLKSIDDNQTVNVCVEYCRHSLTIIIYFTDIFSCKCTQVWNVKRCIQTSSLFYADFYLLIFWLRSPNIVFMFKSNPFVWTRVNLILCSYWFYWHFMKSQI